MAWATKTKGLPKHDHDLGPMNAAKSTTCARCLHNEAATGVKMHTCIHGGAFGRRDTACARCNQLTSGTNLETALGASLKQAARREALRSQSIKEHDFAACSAKSTVCTCFDW